MHSTHASNAPPAVHHAEAEHVEWFLFLGLKPLVTTHLRQLMKVHTGSTTRNGPSSLLHSSVGREDLDPKTSPGGVLVPHPQKLPFLLPWALQPPRRVRPLLPLASTPRSPLFSGLLWGLSDPWTVFFPRQLIRTRKFRISALGVVSLHDKHLVQIPENAPRPV